MKMVAQNTKTLLASGMIAAAAMTLAAVPSLANAAKYKSHTVTKKASFNTLKSHAKSLRKTGVAKVTKIRRHGRVVGFKKTLKSGDKVVVKRGRHGRVTTTTLKRKSTFERLKHKVASAAKTVKHKAKSLRKKVAAKFYGKAKSRH